MPVDFSLHEARCILDGTPNVLSSLLEALPERLVNANEGPGTWSPAQVLKHLIWCEIDDWIPRIQSIREHGRERVFRPLDREEGFRRFEDWTVDRALREFASLRRKNLEYLDTLSSPSDLALQGTHPEFGVVTVEQLVATWAAHDLGHIVQTGRVLTKAIGAYAGPWRAYISVLRSADSSD